MLLTISTTHRPATDLGYLLHKNPARLQTEELSFGTGYVFYPEASEERCTAALLIEIDPVALVRGRGPAGEGGQLEQYVNDRPYAANSFLSVAMGRIFATAMSGRSKERQHLADAAVPLTAHLPVIAARGGEDLVRRLREVNLRREQFSILKQLKSGPLSAPDTAHHLDRYIIYRCVVGSQAYGLNREGSDIDRRGIYLPPAELEWSIYGVPEQLENPQTQECYWELKKFLVLALKANPNILECLFTPIVEQSSEIADVLLAKHHIFLSKLVYQTYNGYVMSQFKRLEQDLRATGELKWKHAMHLIRLLLQGISVLNDSHVPVRVSQHRDALLAIRDGRQEWDEVNGWRLSLHREFELAFQSTSLPDSPDYAEANKLLVWARRKMTEVQHGS